MVTVKSRIKYLNLLRSGTGLFVQKLNQIKDVDGLITLNRINDVKRIG